MKENNLSDKNVKNMLMPQLFGLLTGFGVCFIFLLIFAAALSNSDSSSTLVLIMSLLSQSLGALTGGFVSAKILKKNGLFSGLLQGSVMFIILTVLSMIFGGSGLTVITLIRLILLLICSALGGIFGVNLKKKAKLI